MSNTKTKASLKELNELKQLKKAIVSGHEAVEGFVKSAKDKSRQALAEALLIGKNLARAKAILGFGSFTRWCKQEFPKIGERTVQKYMALHNALSVKANHGSELHATSLRKAYIALGIIKEDEVESGDAGTNATPQATPAATTPVTKATAPVSTMPATAPGTSLSSKLKIEQPKPAISKTDVISRPKYLVKELLLDLQSIIQTNSVPLHELKAATLAPLESFFSEHAKPHSKAAKKPAGKAAK